MNMFSKREQNMYKEHMGMGKTPKNSQQKNPKQSHVTPGDLRNIQLLSLDVNKQVSTRCLTQDSI